MHQLSVHFQECKGLTYWVGWVAVLIEKDCALVTAFQGHADVRFGSVEGCFGGSSDHLSS